MSNSKNNFRKLILAVVSICFAFSVTAYGAMETAQDKLEKGKKLYSEGKYDQAMDSFIDVFVQGNNEQISEANEYVNMIHFSMGAVAAPKQVPYDPALEPKDDGHKGKILSGSQPAKEYQEEGLPSKPAAQAAPSAAAQSPRPSSQDAAIYQTPSNPMVREQIIAQDTLAGDPEELKAMRKEQVDAQIVSQTEKIIARLSKVKGVNVYMRAGLIDAIDIESDVIFKEDKITYTPQAKAVLDDVYALMILSGTPSFVLLPPGSYTDDVSIQGVRQAVALNSYFINMGVSSAKLNFNMGLTSEQPPAKFSNLEGISIVFDYTAKPNLKFKLSDKRLPPVLSLGLYPAESFMPENNEGMLVDFSIVETSAPVADWKLQIIQHDKDGKYYVVRQLSGSGAAYQQMFWNGKKQYFGQILPFGRYTIILKAQDVNGKEKIVRRKVTLVSKEEPKVAAPKEAHDDTILNYNAPRLWTKPGKTAGPGAQEEIAGQEAPAANEVGTFAITDSSVPATATAPAADAAANDSAYALSPNDPLLSGTDYSAPAATAAPAAASAAQAPSANAPYPSQVPSEGTADDQIQNY